MADIAYFKDADKIINVHFLNKESRYHNLKMTIDLQMIQNMLMSNTINGGKSWIIHSHKQ